MKQTETQLQNAICDYLALRKHFYTRINTAGIYSVKRQSFLKRSQHSRNGMSDILAVHVGVPYFLEVKTPTGTQSAEQKLFQKDVEKAGGIYAIVRSIEDVQKLGL